MRTINEDIIDHERTRFTKTSYRFSIKTQGIRMGGV